MTEPQPSTSHLPWRSPANPKLQTAWDSSSLGALEFCPRYYQLTQIEGWKARGVDLEFGGFAATGFETYQKARLEGLSRDEAELRVVKRLLELTWASGPDGTPWGGSYEPVWHCTGTEPFKNEKGNRAKCPYAHAGMWFPGDQPQPCGRCGSPTEATSQYFPMSPAKNRHSLLRLLVWYMEEQPEELVAGLHPVAFPDGRPAVELSGRVPLGLTSRYGDEYILTYNIDYIGQFGDETWIVDNKTTTKALDGRFKSGYSPHYQLDTYDLIASVVFPELDVAGVLIDAAQVSTGGAQFARFGIWYTEAQREEHLQDIRYWVGLAEKFAADDYWPMNKRNCWLCPFSGVCNKEPQMRVHELRDKFTQGEPWNPLQIR
jgi:hypothetical protein